MADPEQHIADLLVHGLAYVHVHVRVCASVTGSMVDAFDRNGRYMMNPPSVRCRFRDKNN